MRSWGQKHQRFLREWDLCYSLISILWFSQWTRKYLHNRTKSSSCLSYWKTSVLKDLSVKWLNGLSLHGQENFILLFQLSWDKISPSLIFIPLSTRTHLIHFTILSYVSDAFELCWFEMRQNNSPKGLYHYNYI